MGAALCVPLFAVPTAGTTVCPQAGIAAATTNVTDKRSSRRCLMTCSPFMTRPFSGMNASTDDTNDFEIEIAPADGTNAAAN